MADNDPVDKALRLFVYGPLGFAAYVRDSAPSFLELFVTRGKREFEEVRRSVEHKLGLTEPEPPPVSTLQKRMADGLGRVASQAGGMVAAVAGPVVTAATTPPSPPSPAPATTPPNGSSPNAGLPIPEYDVLSAGQVIERLDGLSSGALERIRVYELAHRARRTILASIDQLTS